MTQTRDWAIYSVAVYIGLLLGGALIARQPANTAGLEIHRPAIVHVADSDARPLGRSREAAGTKPACSASAKRDPRGDASG